MATALGRVAREHRGDAVPLLAAAQARFPQDFWVNFELGLAFYYAKRFDEAIGCYHAALALRPTASSVHCALAESLMSLNRVQDALRAYQEASRLDPANLASRLNIGSILLTQGRIDEGVSCFREVIRLRPDSRAAAVAHNNIGVVHSNQRRPEEAINEFTEALRLDPTLIAARVNLGNNLYTAACAEVLAAATPENHRDASSKRERAARRRKAIERLQALVELAKQPQKDGAWSDWSLGSLLTDPDLASVREPAQLAKLPDAQPSNGSVFGLTFQR